MKFNEYQNLALRTRNKLLTKTRTFENGVMGLCGEAGELIDHVKKHMFQGHSLDKEYIAKELGDILWYLSLTAHAIDYNLEDIANKNIDKLKKRYPNGFEADKSINRQTEWIK